MDRTRAEDTPADETPDQRRIREHEEAEAQRKADAAAYEIRRKQERAEADARREEARRERGED